MAKQTGENWVRNWSTLGAELVVECFRLCWLWSILLVEPSRKEIKRFFQILSPLSEDNNTIETKESTSFIYQTAWTGSTFIRSMAKGRRSSDRDDFFLHCCSLFFFFFIDFSKRLKRRRVLLGRRYWNLYTQGNNLFHRRRPNKCRLHFI